MDGALSEKLYKTYYMRVYSYLVTLTGDKTLAEELTQECFFRAMTGSSAYRGEADECTWLCAIAKNLYTDELRKRKRHAEMPEEMASDMDVERDAADKDQSFRVHMALHSLSEPYREVLELRVFGELSFRQIGTIFGKTESWARVTFHRAKLQLQERMDKQNI